MNRSIAFVGAVLCASVSIASACSANTVDAVRFTLEPGRQAGEIRATFREDRNGRDHNNWSTSFRTSELAGLDAVGLRAAGSRPVRFALIREAGRLDCAGNGGNAMAIGRCSFASDPGFMQLIQARGVGRPTDRQAFALLAVNARRELLDALARANYPVPGLDDFIALSALNVTPAYIAEMSRLGYRPESIDGLVQFKALGITPEYVGGFTRIGYRDLRTSALVQLKALGVTPEYVLGFQRIGYGQLAPDTLVQLKALGITPDYAAAMQNGAVVPVDRLVQGKIFGQRVRKSY